MRSRVIASLGNRGQPRQHPRLRRDFDVNGQIDLVNTRDLVDTPDQLAEGIVGHFLPQIGGSVLEPCEGGGAFTRAFTAHGLADITALEITRGSDFLRFDGKFSWIITNPPWSLAKQFLQHAYEVAENIVFLITLHHIFDLRSRIADMEQAGFGIKEVLLCETPGVPWPQSGFQLGAVHLQRGYRGTITWGWLEDSQDRGSDLLVPRQTTNVLRASAFAIPLKAESVQTVVTSPSYYGLRQYAGGTENDLGRERTIELYVEHLVMAMREVWRVLRHDGVVFLNLGDSYHGSGRGAGRSASAVRASKSPHCDGNPLRGQGNAKSLCLIPHRVMIALQDDGWIVRNDVIWAKPNCVPESVDDRCTSSYEHVIIMTKHQNYYWNWEEAREPSVCWEKGTLGGGVTASQKDGKMRAFTMRHSNKVGSSKTEKRLSTGDLLREDGTVRWHPVGAGPKGDALVADGTHGGRTKLSPPIGNVKHQALGKPTLVGHRVPFRPTRNMRDVWSIPTIPHKEKHIAMFPESLVKRCIRLGSRPGDLVMDCFAGSGTVGLVARQLGRNSVLMDISEDYVNLMKQRQGGKAHPTAERSTSKKVGSSSQTLVNGHGTTVEWYTPTEIVEAALKTMGSIDCDPCTSGKNHTGAKIFYTVKTNGLDKPWCGNVLLNPPFGKGQALWMYKLDQELAGGRISQVICLTPVWTNAKWFHALCKRGASLCFPSVIKFVDGRTMEQSKRSARSPIVIVYVGHRHEEFRQEFGRFGLLSYLLPESERQHRVKRLGVN
jgi:DNA modification methylase